MALDSMALNVFEALFGSFQSFEAGLAKIPEASIQYQYCIGISKVLVSIDTYRFLINSYTAFYPAPSNFSLSLFSHLLL
jgi:hypothetical protein